MERIIDKNRKEVIISIQLIMIIIMNWRLFEGIVGGDERINQV